MRVTFFRHEKDRASVRESGWMQIDITHQGVEVTAPHKEDIVKIAGQRYVVREVRWSYGLGAGYSPCSIAEAHVYLWKAA